MAKLEKKLTIHQKKSNSIVVLMIANCVCMVKQRIDSLKNKKVPAICRNVLYE